MTKREDKKKGLFFITKKKEKNDSVVLIYCVFFFIGQGCDRLRGSGWCHFQNEQVKQLRDESTEFRIDVH